jgi:HlyD family secretion protein
MHPGWRRVLWVTAAAAGAAAIVWALLPRPVAVEVATVTSGRFVATVDEDGTAHVRERYVVAAPLAGRTTRIHLKVGDAVAAGDVIVAILPAPAPFLDPRSRREVEERLGAAEATRERARALVERARIQAAQARTDLERTRTLVARGAATVQALERDELTLRVTDRDLRAAESQDHAAEHEVEQARALLARYDQNGEAAVERWNVTAPVAGVILKVAQESETVVYPGSPLVEIGDPRDLEIVADVLSTEAVEIPPQAEVAIERWGGAGALSGRVRRVEPTAFTKISTLGVEEQRVNVRIDIVTPPEQWTRLGDGYRVEVRIVVLSRDDAVIVPSGALFRVGSQWYAYGVRAGRAERRPLEVLRRAGHTAAIASGVALGESVVLYPGDRVAQGVRVEARQ